MLVDTAGLRRRSKVAGTVDYYAQLRSERAAERADVALVVCDATEGITSQDLRIADLAMRKGCATIVVLNKWDIGDDRPRGRQATGWPPSCACAHACMTASATDRPQRRAGCSIEAVDARGPCRAAASRRRS